MTKEIKDLIMDYFKEAFDFNLYESEQIWELTVPFLDAHNDLLQIYIKKEGENYKVSDGDYIRYEFNNKSLPMFIGTTHFKEDGEIYAIVKESDLPNTIIDLITLMLIVSHRRLTNKIILEREK